MQYITALDYVLLPFVLALIYGLAYRKRRRLYPEGHPWRLYYIPGLSVKVFGALFIGLIYAYYYKGGDSFQFFRHAEVINSAMDDSFRKWFNLIFHIPAWNDPEYYPYISQMEWYQDPSSYTVISITAVLSLLTAGTYLPASMLFAFISFSGIWALFRTFATVYPHLLKPVAVAALFIPSTFVWGSGIFKDTVCMFGLGWLTYGSFRLLVHRDFGVGNIALTILSAILLFVVKVYILLSFLPALAVWILFINSQRIGNMAGRFLLKLVSMGLIIAGFLFFMARYSDQLGKYSLDRLSETSLSTRGWIYYVSERDEGSAYDLGEFDPSIQGMLTKMPAAINVTLFRPYFWESGKVIVLLSAIEAFLFLALTLRVLFSVGLLKSWQAINRDPTIQFCLIFTLIFAFAVGISSYNFGALSRYKIPCLPFFAMGLILIFYKSHPPSKKIFPLLGF